MQIRHLPPLLRFIPQFAQICIVFALSKFEANPFFRPVFIDGPGICPGSILDVSYCLDPLDRDAALLSTLNQGLL